MMWEWICGHRQHALDKHDHDILPTQMVNNLVNWLYSNSTICLATFLRISAYSPLEFSTFEALPLVLGSSHLLPWYSNLVVTSWEHSANSFLNVLLQQCKLTLRNIASFPSMVKVRGFQITHVDDRMNLQPRSWMHLIRGFPDFADNFHKTLIASSETLFPLALNLKLNFSLAF